MSVPASGVNYIVRKESDNSIVGNGTTNASGVTDFTLPPGKYKVTLGTIVGFTPSSAILNEPGNSGQVHTYAGSPSVILDVDIVEGQTTTITETFTQN